MNVTVTVPPALTGEPVTAIPAAAGGVKSKTTDPPPTVRLPVPPLKAYVMAMEMAHAVPSGSSPLAV